MLSAPGREALEVWGAHRLHHLARVAALGRRGRGQRRVVGQVGAAQIGALRIAVAYQVGARLRHGRRLPAAAAAAAAAAAPAIVLDIVAAHTAGPGVSA